MNKKNRDSTTQYQQNNFIPFKKNSFHYFLAGLSLAFHSRIRRFVFLPMLANIVIMSALFYWLFSSLSGIIDFGLAYVPSWLQWLGYLLTFVVIIMMAIFFCYFFSTITNIIAAPFNSLLAEQVESLLTGMPAQDAPWSTLIADLPRVFYRELEKLRHYFLWAIVLFLSSFIPLFGQVVTPVVWFLFTAWQINLTYADYAFDNHKITFFHMRQLLRQDSVDNLAFGALISLFTMVPLLNLVIMPVAVCGATAVWVDRYRKQAILSGVLNNA